MTKEEVQQLPLEYYPPSQSMEHYDEEEGVFYNRSGNRLRNIEEYQPDEDGCYEPFGDE